MVQPLFSIIASQSSSIPAKYTAANPEGAKGLTFGLLLYNEIVDYASNAGLGVIPTDVSSVHHRFLAVRNILQLVSGREGDFNWGKVWTGALRRADREKNPRSRGGL